MRRPCLERFSASKQGGDRSVVRDVLARIGELDAPVSRRTCNERTRIDLVIFRRTIDDVCVRQQETIRAASPDRMTDRAVPDIRLDRRMTVALVAVVDEGA